MWNSLRLWNLDFPVSRQSWGSGGPGSGQGIENVSLQLMPQANNKKEALNKMPCDYKDAPWWSASLTWGVPFLSVRL